MAPTPILQKLKLIVPSGSKGKQKKQKEMKPKVGKKLAKAIEAQIRNDLGGKWKPREEEDTFLPWVKKTYERSYKGLHEEIVDFCEWMGPSHAEYNMRCDVTHRLRDVVCDLWPNAAIEVFGSFRQGLYLPDSDIDVVVLSEECGTSPNGKPGRALWQLRDAILRARVCSRYDMQCIPQARVPIIKMNDEKCNVQVDISFNLLTGLKCVELVEEYKSKHPMLHPLVVIIKQILRINGMSDPAVGGLGAYSLILMIVHIIEKNAPEKDLGRLLAEFCRYFGATFNYNRLAVCPSGQHLYKHDFRERINKDPKYLSIADPLDRYNDTARATDGHSVESLFAQVNRDLTNALNSNHAGRGSSSSASEMSDHDRSILSSIVHVTQSTLSAREMAARLFPNAPSPSACQPPQRYVYTHRTNHGPGLMSPPTHQGPGSWTNHTQDHGRFGVGPNSNYQTPTPGRFGLTNEQSPGRFRVTSSGGKERASQWNLPLSMRSKASQRKMKWKQNQRKNMYVEEFH